MTIFRKIRKITAIFLIAVIFIPVIAVFSALYYINNSYLQSPEFKRIVQDHCKDFKVELEGLELSVFSVRAGSIRLNRDQNILTGKEFVLAWDWSTIMDAANRRPLKVGCTIREVQIEAVVPGKGSVSVPAGSVRCTLSMDPLHETGEGEISGVVFQTGSFKITFKGKQGEGSGTLDFSRIESVKVLAGMKFDHMDKVTARGMISGDFTFRAAGRKAVLNGAAGSEDFVIVPDFESIPPEFNLLSTFMGNGVKVSKVTVKDLCVENGILRLEPPVIVETDLTELKISGFADILNKLLDMEISFLLPSAILDNPFYSFVGKKDMGMVVKLTGNFEAPRFSFSNY